METQKCSKCEIEKPTTEFYRENKRNGVVGLWFSAKCKACKDEYIRAYRRNNRERYNGYMRERRKDPSVRAKERAAESARYHHPNGKRKLKHKMSNRARREAGYDIEYLYGITLEQRQKMFDDQKGQCLLCGAHESTLKRKLCIDHCHATKSVRGLLCDNCNKVLGLIKDRTDILKNAIAYLSR